MSSNGDRMIEFEGRNWTELAEEFLASKDIVDKWEQFVYDKYCDMTEDIEPEYDHEDRE